MLEWLLVVLTRMKSAYVRLSLEETRSYLEKRGRSMDATREISKWN